MHSPVMRSIRFDPFAVALSDLDRLFDAVGAAAFRAPRVDIYEEGDRLFVAAELPGVTPDEVEVTVEDANLVISGSAVREDSVEGRRYHRREIAQGTFERSVIIPDEYDTGTVTAEYHDGVLTVAISKRPEVLPRKIDVQVNGSAA